MNRLLFIALSLALVAQGFIGCAMFGTSDSLVRAEDYHVNPPKDWKQRSSEESDSAYRLPSGSLATVTSSCTRGAKTTLKVLTRHLLMGTRNVKFLKQEPLTVEGGSALHSSVKATIDKVQFRLELVVFRKSGCVFDFSLLKPKTLSEKDVAQFLAFARSLKYGER